MELFSPRRAVTGVDTRAVVSPEAELGDEVSIGACAVVGPGARIGARTTIGSGVVIGRDVQIGEDCFVDANATVLDRVRIGDRCVIHPGAVIGGEGFGFHWLGDHHHRVPQLGTVVLEDDVEVGCNSCIDRATLGETRVGQGTKIDNLVHLAHNNRLGRHVILAGQVGTAGSVSIGDGAMLGGQVGVSDHVRIGAGARVGGKAAVTKDVAARETVWGAPARGMQRVMRELAALGRLPEALRHLKALTRRIEHLEASSSAVRAKDPEN
jgi:UDP-3-O-[3-hydroxymyristoyl] glucosamine N-acyltransferase